MIESLSATPRPGSRRVPIPRLTSYLEKFSIYFHTMVTEALGCQAAPLHHCESDMSILFGKRFAKRFDPAKIQDDHRRSGHLGVVIVAYMPIHRTERGDWSVDFASSCTRRFSKQRPTSISSP